MIMNKRMALDFRIQTLKYYKEASHGQLTLNDSEKNNSMHIYIQRGNHIYKCI